MIIKAIKVKSGAKNPLIGTKLETIPSSKKEITKINAFIQSSSLKQ